MRVGCTTINDLLGWTTGQQYISRYDLIYIVKYQYIAHKKFGNTQMNESMLVLWMFKKYIPDLPYSGH